MTTTFSEGRTRWLLGSDFGDPFKKVFGGEEIDDAVRGDAGEESGGQREVEKGQLPGMVGIAAE